MDHEIQQGRCEASPPTPCSQLRSADDAPRDGTIILLACGWPWLVPAAWNECESRWVICMIQSSPMSDGTTDSWWESELERPEAVLGWLPMPELPPGTPAGGFLRPANDSDQGPPR